MGGCFAGICVCAAGVCTSCVCCLPRLKNAVQYPRTGITDSCGYGELNLDPLENQRVLLISKPSLEPHVSNYVWALCLPRYLSRKKFHMYLMNSHPYCHKLSWLDDIMKVILLLRYINKCLTYIFLKEIPHFLKLINISETTGFYIDYSFAVNLQLEIFCSLIFWFLFVLSYFVTSFPVPLDWLWIYCVNQAGFELLRVPLSHSPQHWDDSVCLTDKMSRNQFPLPNLYINWNHGHMNKLLSNKF